MTSSSLSNERGNDYDLSKRQSRKSRFLSHSLEEEEEERREEELEVEKSFLFFILLLPSRTRGGTTMTSLRDRVVRARTTYRATTSDHRSWRKFTWVSVTEGDRLTMCDTISP